MKDEMKQWLSDRGLAIWEPNENELAAILECAERLKQEMDNDLD